MLFNVKPHEPATLVAIAAAFLLVLPMALRAADSDAGVRAEPVTGDIRKEAISGYKFVQPETALSQPAPFLAPKAAAGKLSESVNPLVSPDSSTAVVVLPKVVVEGMRQRRLTGEELLTYKGTVAAAEAKYISPLYSATFGPLGQILGYVYDWPSIFGGWHPGEIEAVEFYRQDQRLDKLSELDSLIDLERLDGPAGGKGLQRVRSTFYIESR